jgi:TolB-like protein
LPAVTTGRILVAMSESASPLGRLFADLKRRKVFRVMAVYGATAFVVLQVVDLAFPRLGMPEWTVTFILLAAMAGFPVAVALAWAFDSTPEGVVRTADAAPGELEAIAAQPALRRWPAGLLALAGVALLFGGGWWMGQRSGAERVDGTTTLAGAQADARSVAVLPFVDMSEAGDQEWFADGLTEEILNSLAALPELKVTARTSSFQFKGQDRDIKEIADTLGVAHVVEGSLRRIGDELVVTAQLIRAADGTHVWSNRYERSAEDLFDVQGDVAEKVAAALDVFLDDGKREAMFRSGTRNVEAFEAYLRGAEEAEKWHAGKADPGSDAGQAEFERAMALDPEYAEAAIAHMDQYSHVVMDGRDIGLSQEEARAAMLRDLAFAAEHASNPTTRLVAEINAELFASTWFRMRGLIDQLATRPDVGRLQVSRGGVGWLRHVVVVADRDLARTLAEADTAASPLDPTAWWGLALVELADGDLEAAREILERGRRRAGNHRFMNLTEYLIDLREDPSPARRWVERAEDESETGFPRNSLLPAYRALGDEASVAALARRIDALPGGSAMFMQVIAVSGSVPFDLPDTPNFAIRLEEAGIDLSDFGTPADVEDE